MGVRYKRFCSNVCRTFFVNPTAEQKRHYEVALQLQRTLIENLKPGAKLGGVFETVEKVAKEEEVSKYFSPNLGFGIGIEFMERFHFASFLSSPFLPFPVFFFFSYFCFLALSFFHQKKPHLIFCSRFLSIVPQSTKGVKEGMVFNIDIGLSGMELDGGEGYAIKISDTVKVFFCFFSPFPFSFSFPFPFPFFFH